MERVKRIILSMFVICYLAGCDNDNTERVDGCIVLYGDDFVTDLEVQVYSDARQTEILNFSSFTEEMKVFSDQSLRSKVRSKEIDGLNCDYENRLSGSRGSFEFLCSQENYDKAEKIAKDFIFKVALMDENGKQTDVSIKLPVHFAVMYPTDD